MKKKEKKLKRKVVKISEVYSASPITFDDVQVILTNLSDGNPLIVNFNQVGIEAMQRFIDYMSGAMFVLQGSIKQLTDVQFLFVPGNVTVVSPA